MTSPVVVDGRLARGKLDELLALAAEHPELDFKATLDLNDSAHRLGLIKDLIAMSNSGTGGYIVIGAKEDGTPATEHPSVDPRQFDSADLAQQVARHVVTAPIITSQTHVLDGWPFILIHVAPPASRLPILISRSGEYQAEKRMKMVLTEGVLYVREGTRTVTATDAHWPQILERYRNSVVAETRESIDVLIGKVVDGLGEKTSERYLVPLADEMDDATYAEAIAAYFDTPESLNKLRRFLRSLRPLAGVSNEDVDSRRGALTKLAIAAVQAVLADSREGFDVAVSIVYDLYLESVGLFTGDYATQRTAAYWLDVLLCQLAVGAVVVRESAWWAVATLVNRPVNDEYPVWLRHAIVHASRANLLSGHHREAAMVLVRTRALIVANPSFAPDVSTLVAVPDDDDFPKNDVLLNSLCRFDILWCTVAVATHSDAADGQLFYPSCAALFQERADPAIILVASSEVTRRALLPDTEDGVWAAALGRVLEVAVNQSRQYRAWWTGVDTDYRVRAFVMGRGLTTP